MNLKSINTLIKNTKIIWSILLVCNIFNCNAQTTLYPGDIAFVTYNTDDTDEFSFVLLKEFTPGTTLKLTDKGWTGSEFYQTGERVLTWTATSQLSCGTHIVIDKNLNVSSGSLISSADTIGLNLSAGDQVLAYTGPDSEPYFIAGIHGDFHLLQYDSVTTWNTYKLPENVTSSVIPDGLTNGMNALSLFPGVPELDNSSINCSSIPSVASPFDFRSAFNNLSNWLSNDTSSYLQPISCGFTCILMPVSIITQPVNKNVCEFDTVSFEIMAEGAYNYQWEESKDGGLTYSLLQDSSYYSGTWAPVLKIFNVQPEMNNFHYRCKVYGDSTQTTSTAAILNVDLHPSVSFAGNPFATTKTEFELVAESPTHGVGHWSVEEGESVLIDVFDNNTRGSNLSYGTNTFTWTIESGVCPSSTAQLEVYRPESFKIYNFMTPNNDGKNDAFTIDALEFFPSHDISILNSAGNTIFHSTGYNNDWQASGVPAGIYTYLIRFFNPNEVHTGKLFIRR